MDGNVLIRTGGIVHVDHGTTLAIAGQLDFQGSLVVDLAADSAEPEPGDMFDILDFETFTGQFNSLQLPALSPGLAWNISELSTTGVLQVVDNVDFDNDGDVDGLDFLTLQRTDINLLAHWQSLYGKQLVSGNSAALVVPEVSPWAMAICLGLMGSWCRHTPAIFTVSSQ